MKITGRDAAKEILECMGISDKNVRNVRIVIDARLDSAAVATIEIDRLIEDDEIAMLATIANECEPDIVQRIVQPEVENSVADVTTIADEYKRRKMLKDISPEGTVIKGGQNLGKIGPRPNPPGGSGIK